MQRVSSLLPLWDRSKSAENTSNANGTAAASTTPPASAAALTSPSPALHNRSSTISNKSASYNYHNQSNTSISNRYSNASSQQRSGRSLFSWADRIGISKTLTVSPSIANAPQASSLATPMGREAYWPSTIDRECEKAARILKSFCTDGFLDEAADPTPTSPRSRTSITSLTSPRFPPRKSADVPPGSPTAVLAQPKKKIPPRIIQEAVGLAIFSCMRSGLWMSGSGGSGILIARKADGTWSPPSGIMLHTATVAFVMGVDIYDCVLVINSFATLEMFTRSRVTLGSDVPLSVGPLVTMGLLENDVRFNHEMGDSVLTYLKARGRHSPAQLHGSLVTERSNENEKFYNNDESSNGSQPIDIQDILAGNVRRSIPEILPLFEAIKAAEGRIDFDTATMDRLSQQPAPGDADIAETPSLLTPASPNAATFGIPDATDPDPFGIIALEMAGLEIREAGSKHRPASQFDFTNASPTSPLFNSRFSHQSTEPALDNGNRASILSTRTQATSMTDAYTQTDVAETPDTSLSPTHSDDGKDAQEATASQSRHSSIPELSVHTPPADDDDDDEATAAAAFQDAPPAIPPRNRLSRMSTVAVTTEKRSSQYLTVDRAAETEDQAQAIQVKGALVNIPKRIPPPLPTRSPARTSRASKSDYGGDVSMLASPMRNSFQSAKTVDISSESFDSEAAKVSLDEAAREDAGKDVIPTQAQQEAVAASTEEIVATPTEKTAAASEETAAPTEETTPASSSSSSSATFESNTDLTAVENDDSRPLTPPAAEPTVSSIDESDLEPKTPRPDDVIKFVSHNGHAELNKAATQTHEAVALNGDELDAATVALP
ncbi:las seventeen-binding protein [Ophiostoma piceae UAMH 11346]|uniref:Las seventeen-binding protein n=1 Tax=Ophiostoma piceae (strain UAMH 11346) TaxID=1262450 RepID=S3CI49_OPHP1|nr:las seventeen-binding protein [Ophiostoma piceae UAMH 11346]